MRLNIFLLAIVTLHLCAFGSNDSIRVNEPKRTLRFPDQHISSTPMHADSTDVLRLEPKNFWLAAGETFGSNMALWAFDRYVIKGPYAYISWETIKENFRHGFEWDNDHLSTNMFLHPYNGSIFFNAGRSNGYNFWQSELFAIGGSAMWEMFMEREYPSTNDIIATPIGGAAIGEVLYRTSDLALDDRTTGFDRFGRELSAFLISPMRGLTRILTGRAWERRRTTGRRFGVPPISVEIATGGRLLTSLGQAPYTRAGSMTRLKVHYGDRFASFSNQPYEYFDTNIELQNMKSQPVLSRMEISGRLLSRELVDKDNLNLSVGMFQHFDYFDSDTISTGADRKWNEPCNIPYKLGVPASVGVGTLFRYETRRDWTVDGFLHVNCVLLGGTLTDWYREYNRNYNWGAGYALKYGLNFSKTNRKLSFYVGSQLYKLFTGTVVDNWDEVKQEYIKPTNTKGDESSTLFMHYETQVSYHLKEHLYLSGLVDYFYRLTKYSGHLDIDDPYITFWDMNSKQLGVQLLLTYKF